MTSTHPTPPCFMLAAVEGMAATGAQGCVPVAAGDEDPDPDWQPL